MTEREPWAVTAAGYLACALRAIREGRGVNAEMAGESADRAYRDTLFAVGTVPADRLDYLRAATLIRGLTVTDALDEIGA
jgi:hypothetical protein